MRELKDQADESTSAAHGGGGMAILLLVVALLALAALGAVLYLQYTEHEYYKAAPSVWPAGAGDAGYVATPSTVMSTPPASSPESATAESAPESAPQADAP